MSFHNRKRAAQLIDFAGIQWGKLRPTDIDLSIDWGGKSWVFVEIKSINAPLTVGQRIHLEGLVKAINRGGLTAHAIVAKHDTKASEDIMAKDCIVYSVFDGHIWERVCDTIALDQAMNTLYNEHIERQQA